MLIFIRFLRRSRLLLAFSLLIDLSLVVWALSLFIAVIASNGRNWQGFLAQGEVQIMRCPANSWLSASFMFEKSGVRSKWINNKNQNGHFGFIFPSVREPAGMLVIRIPIWCFTVGLAGCALPAMARARRKKEASRCDRCAYDLQGNVTGICPECGNPCESQAI